MKIVTYHSANARPKISWIAYIVGEKPEQTKSTLEHGETNDPKGFLPMRITGPTEEAVSQKAADWWLTGEKDRERKKAARKANAEKRARKEVKA